MKAPACPDHGRLVLDLALGRLEDERAATAELVRGSCPICSGWWRTELEGPVATKLDAVLQSSFSAFEPPARRRVARWLPVAATAALAVGAGILWQADRTEPPALTRSDPSIVAIESFEGDRDGNGVVDVADIGFATQVDQAGEVIFTESLDDGDLSGWTPHT